MTERLYYADSTLTGFTARIVAVDGSGTRVELDRTAFYPESGGQPRDFGTLGGIAVTDILEEDGRIIHMLAGPFPGRPGETVQGIVDRDRRRDHMQQHTGQHLLSAVIAELYGVQTVSFHMGGDLSTIELACETFTAEMAAAAERRALEHVIKALPVTVQFADAADVEGLRKATARTGTIRIVEITGVDRSACGGTHVGNTAEIGPVLVRGAERIRGNVRIGFVCGMRALTRAREESELLLEAARLLSCSSTAVPRSVQALAERAALAEKACQRSRSELAEMRGKDLYRNTAPDAAGLRVAIGRADSLDDSTRTEAQAFTAGERSVFVCLAGGNKPSLLLAVSEDSGLHAGNLLKPVLSRFGGRGGGSARSAQGSLGDSSTAEAALTALLQELR